MIQNITQGSNFAGAIKYVHGKDGAERIAGNMSGETPRQLDREWGVYREMNSVVKEDVFHASLSLPEGERLSDEQWQDAAQVYVEKMGFDKSAWVAYRHTDTDHDHIHVIANRIDYDGRAVDMWQSYSRGENICRELEKEHGLTRVEPSRNADLRAPKRAEFEMYQRTGEVSVKIDLQGRVEAAARASDTWSQYADELGKQGVGVAINRRESGQPYGISYIRESDGETMKGSDLGRAYAWSGLQKRAGIDYEYGRDDEAISRAETRGRAATDQREHRETGTPDHGTTRGDERTNEENRGTAQGDVRSVKGSAGQDRTANHDSRSGHNDRGDAVDAVSRADVSGSQSEGRADDRKAGRDGVDDGNDPRSVDGRGSQQEPDQSGGRRTTRDAEGDQRGDSTSARRVIERNREVGNQSGGDRGVDRRGDDGGHGSARGLVSEQPRPEAQGFGQERANQSGSRAEDANALSGMDARGAGDVGKALEREANPSAEEIKPTVYQISDETRRELWKETQIMERIQQGHDLQNSGQIRGEVVAVEQFGEKAAAVVSDGQGKFSVVSLDQKSGIEPGQKVTMTQKTGQPIQIKIEAPTAAKDKGRGR